MGGASVALGGLILLVTVAVPPAQAEVCDFSMGTDPTNLAPETFRFCVDKANDDTGVNIVRGTEGTPSTVTLTQCSVGVTSSMTIDGPTP